MNTQDELTAIRSQSVKPSHFEMIPNMAIYELSPAAFKLLAIYLNIAETNLVYATNQTISERLGTSTNTMKKAREELAEKGYINYKPGLREHEKDERQTAVVTILSNDIWTHNRAYFQKDDPMSNSDMGMSEFDMGMSEFDRNKNYIGKDKNNNSRARARSTNQSDSDRSNDPDETPQPAQKSIYSKDENKLARQFIGIWAKYHVKANDGSHVRKNMTLAQSLVDRDITLDEWIEHLHDLNMDAYWGGCNITFRKCVDLLDDRAPHYLDVIKQYNHEIEEDKARHEQHQRERKQILEILKTVPKSEWGQFERTIQMALYIESNIPFPEHLR